jgi:hypothetical protein
LSIVFPNPPTIALYPAFKPDVVISSALFLAPIYYFIGTSAILENLEKNK